MATVYTEPTAKVLMVTEGVVADAAVPMESRAKVDARGVVMVEKDARARPLERRSVP